MRSADLRENWPAVLLGAGFDPEATTAWRAEAAVLPAAETERELLDSITRLSATGCHSFEYTRAGVRP